MDEYMNFCASHENLASRKRADRVSLLDRYPDDPYDRLWITPGPTYTITTDQTSKMILVPDYNFDKPPMVVMQTAWLGELWWFTPVPQYELQKTVSYYTSLFFAEIQTVNASGIRAVKLEINGIFWGALNVTVSTNTLYQRDLIVDNQGVNFSLSALPVANLSPLLNAAEIYASRAAVVMRTNDVDGNSHLLPVASLKVRKAASTGLCSRMRIGDMRFCQHSSFHNVD